MTDQQFGAGERISVSAHQPEEAEQVHAADDHPLRQLHKQIGNQAMQRMLAQRQSLPQAPPIRRQEQEDLLQAVPEVGLEGGQVSSETASRINANRGGGSPLGEGLKSSMEPLLGSNLEDVRVHSDSESHQLNRTISAKAFTTGNDIFLGSDASASDTSLMAHELTHVVQQRSMSMSGPMTVGPADDSYEQQADAVASAPAPSVQRKPEPTNAVQRQPEEEEEEEPGIG